MEVEDHHEIPVELQVSEAPVKAEELLAPGVPIVRSNTSRPQHLGAFASETSSTSQFPAEAPSAPPLPEESDDLASVVEFTPLPFVSKSDVPKHEFVWLFEYGLMMDSGLLNSAERLNGLAFCYGRAVLKGYQLRFAAVDSPAGQVITTLVPSHDPSAEVWGVLYRVPTRLTEQAENEFSLLDKAHGVGCFEPAQVTVREEHRGRDIVCVTYMATDTARQQFQRLPVDSQCPDAALVQHLVNIASQQKLPPAYLHSLEALSGKQSELRVIFPPTTEQNTEPLPVMLDTRVTQAARQDLPTVSSQRGLRVFALYLVVLFLAILALAVVQGLGVANRWLTPSFLPLGIPWLVLVYGLLGGCISSIVTLKKYQVKAPAGFILVTWSIRPFVGAVFGAVAYLLLTSGLFVLSGDAHHHTTLFSLVAVVAGYGEGWLFTNVQLVR